MALTLATMLLVQLSIAEPADFSDDFSTDSLDGWTTYAWNYDLGIPLDPTFEVINGSMVSSGTFISRSISLNKINAACQQTDIGTGYWRYQIFGSDVDIWRIGFRISVFPPLRFEGYTDEYLFDPTNIQAVISHNVNKIDGEYVTQLFLGQLRNTGDGSGDYSGFQNLDTMVIEETDVMGWHTFDLHKTDTTITLEKDGELMLTGTLNQSIIGTYDSICLWTDIGSGLRIDNIKASISPIVDDTEPSDNISLDRLLLYLGIGAAVIVAVGYPTLKYLRKKGLTKKSSLKSGKQLIQTSAQQLNVSDSSILSLIYGGYRADSELTQEDVDQLIPSNLLNYRYLMHPVRLSIMKLLDKNHKLTSVTLKHLLGISWGDYSNHIKSLQERQYVELSDEFNDDGHLVQNVYILENGRNEYHRLVELLMQFLDSESPLRGVLDLNIGQDQDEYLYPEDS